MIITYLIYLFMGIGIFFMLFGGIGLIRMPDVYTRLHAGTKCTTFGSIFLTLSVIILGLKNWYLGDVNGSVLAIHTIVALIAILITNPTGAHAIAKAAHRSGIKPVNAIVDDLEKKEEERKNDS
ncbi:monovalent cation/H(+) antiporter subunit G [candidate division WOR-3 bacterium]|nr:monovalent cation/H(+) antiporter subunit G [candidate division WOR-3 bacterium]